MLQANKCTCGDLEEQHVDGCEQCIIPECGCKEFNSEVEANAEIRSDWLSTQGYKEGDVMVEDGREFVIATEDHGDQGDGYQVSERKVYLEDCGIYPL